MRSNKNRYAVRRAAVLAVVTAVAAAAAIPSAYAVSGNIGTAQIQIDGGTNGADLYPGTGTPVNTGAAADWVKDSTANGGTGCLVASVASCNEIGVTSATTLGHWNGARIVDGVAGNDQDIFLTGGKENDTSTWNVGPGSIGSSKYDATQAYLANNSTTLYFGMERRGNNGTTAFDFEFNQAAPTNASGYIPKRSNGDALFTFEVSGSGSSGSATPHVFYWSGNETTQVGSYVEESPLPSGILTTINNVPTPAAPWGYVDSKGNWTTGNLDRFEFAEAAVDLAGVFDAFDPCGTAPYYVQLRTRSSSTANSDLKDTTKIFDYSFTPGAAPTASKTSSSASAMSVTLTGVSDAGTTKQWQKNTVASAANDSNWANVSGATGATYAYSAFDTDVPLATAPEVAYSTGAAVAIANTTNANGSYVGKVQTVYFRLVASKSVGGSTCTSTSTPVTVKKVQLVDP